MTLLGEWLPHGKLNQQKNEFVCGSLSGDAGSSLSVNIETGLWKDFCTGESGRDLLDLYAAIHDLSKGRAAVQVAREYGLESVAGLVKAPAGGAPIAPPPPRPAPQPKPVKESEKWETIKPAPLHHLQPTFLHPAKERSKDRIDHTARYQVGDDLYGFVVRFIDSEGEKVTIPYTYARSLRDGTETWKWRFWADPRPLYFPGGQLPNGRTVVLVEGERKAECLQLLLDAVAPGVYCVASWPGGSNAWQKALWEWLAGCTVIMWPDCDSLREKPPRDELKACTTDDERAALAAKQPYLAFEAQPGMKAMLGIGALLRDEHGCTVQLLPVDKPGVKPSGWDCRDAIETDGWDFDRVLAYFGTARALLADVSAPAHAAAGGGGGDKPPKNRDASAGAGAGSGGGDSGGEGDDDPFGMFLDEEVARLRLRGRWLLRPRRGVLIEALRSAPELAGCVAFDELRERPIALRAFPWRDAPGPLADADVLRLANFIESRYGTGEASAQTTEQAINVAADENRVHPFRDWLRAQEWDEKPRLEKWLIHVLGLTPSEIKPKLLRYLQLVSKFIVMGHVARVMTPGCKFDYSVVLEGKGGIGKSSMVRTLVGKEFFSDTHFDIGNGKDGMEQLSGIVAYELSEMTAFRRADSEAVKAFFSSESDRFRGAYGRFVQEHPRQCVIWCTTNKRQYLFDITGNRRFWPVLVEGRTNLEWLRKFRGQLFAEALALFEAGERYHPTPEEEKAYFEPEQEKRLVETSVQGRLWSLLTREGISNADGKATQGLSQLTQFVTIPDLVQALGADPGKSSAMLDGQVRDWLFENGWQPGREGGGQRRRGFKQPDVWPPKFQDEDVEATPAKQVGGQQGPMPPAAAPWGEDDDYAPL
ncbi:MAG: VapE family protein [Acidovorax sp.]|nr:VapE family protein [Acidovorax sp.]